MNIKQLAYGVATFVPGVSKIKIRGTGGTNSSRYCYSIWLRHLVMADQNGLSTNPKTVAELGPGDSLGIGIAALIGGCNKYYAFDVVDFTNLKRNLKIFNEIVELFKRKEDIPDDKEFPNAKPHLSEYSFPSSIFSRKKLHEALDKSRIKNIRDSIYGKNTNDKMITYKVPWYESNILKKKSVDMIYSQAVLEHIDELENAYKAMWLWLKNDGFISHQIDFKSHGTAREWNGHWAFSDFVWKLFRGKRPYFINRLPHSAHINILEEVGFNLVCDKTVSSESKLSKNDFSKRFRSITDDDLKTSGTFIQALKHNAKVYK